MYYFQYAWSHKRACVIVFIYGISIYCINLIFYLWCFLRRERPFLSRIVLDFLKHVFKYLHGVRISTKNTKKQIADATPITRSIFSRIFHKESEVVMDLEVGSDAILFLLEGLTCERPRGVCAVVCFLTERFALSCAITSRISWWQVEDTVILEDRA